MRATSAVTIALGATAAVVVGALVQATGAGSAGGGPGPGLGVSVPAEYRGLIEEAGNTCPDVSPNLLAALIKQESGFNPRAQSNAGAQGITQFMPSTWESEGIDANSDGKRDVWDPEDAIPSAGKHLCTLAEEVANVPGDKQSNILAAYNAGSPRVIAAGGVPEIEETQTYVKSINAMANRPNGGGKTATSTQAATAVNAAKSEIGTPYSWGGGNANGVTKGSCCSPNGSSGASITGFDCSGLALYAYAQAGIDLPRTAAQQYAASEHVNPGQMRPGDLVFYGTSAANIHHVGIYVGNGYIINAPKPGTRVRYDPMDLMSDLYAVARPTPKTNKEI